MPDDHDQNACTLLPLFAGQKYLYWTPPEEYEFQGQWCADCDTDHT